MASASSGLKSTSINGVKMYSLSGQRSLPSWLPPKKLKSLRKEKAYMRRIDMLQDLGFETASTRIKATPDGEFIIASGIYPPQIKVYEVRELSLKFERHLISEIINFQILSDDYSKLAFLCSDRSVCLHAKYGSHYSLRIPRMGRDIAYDCWSCDLLCAASSPDLYRINLEQGRFLSPFNTQSPAISVVRRSSFHGLVACGGEDGAVECFDTRVKLSVGRINAVGSTNDVDQEVTALQFDDIGGYLMAIGSSSGKVLIYDLRSSHPIKVKDHMYGSPIIDIKWHQTPNSSRANLITTDNHIVRIWDPDTGNGMTSVEPSGGAINDVCVYPESGLMLLALDCSQIPSYFIPTLGPAPKWIPYLENMTEELEEGPETTIYDDYKFLTKEELERLNLTNLIGTNLLRAYMHGYFINYRLYKKAQSLSDPFAYDVYIEQKKKEKIEAERASRITIKRKLPKVNRFLASKLLDNEEGQTEEVNDDSKTIKKSKKRKGLTSDVLKDERFTAMFEDKDFEVDEKSAEYLALHPIASQKQRPTLIEEHFKPVEEEDTDQSVSDSDISPSSEDELVKDTNKGIKKSSRVPRLYEIKDERHAEAFWNSVSLAKEGTLTLEERVTALEAQQDPGLLNGVKFGPGGSREISFSSRSSTKFKGDDEDEPKRGKRRGIQSLGLKSDRPKFRGKFHAHRGKG